MEVGTIRVEAMKPDQGCVINSTPFDFYLRHFYGVEATEFFSLGISCLAKMKDGNAYAGEYPGEAKTEDLNM
jgi:hypothetical protein